MPACSVCEPNLTVGEKNGYIIISGSNPIQYMCNGCFGKEDYSPTVASQKHLPMVNRWKCLVHNCGSYNFNNMDRHEMPWCKIITEQTVGVILPGTFGGYNGNLSRQYFKDWHEHCLRLQQEALILRHNQEQVAKGPVREKSYAYRNKTIQRS